MPIYEYACQKCGHELDALEKISDPPLKKCPACGALKLKRLVSAPQFRLKGTGWYETDFKSESDKKKRLADSGDAPPESGDKKSEQKSDEKSGDKNGQKSDQSSGEKAVPSSGEKSSDKSSEKSRDKSTGTDSAKAGGDKKPAKEAKPKKAAKSGSDAA